MKVASYTKTGIKANAASSLPSSVFSVKSKNHRLLGEAIRAGQASRRLVSAKTLLRGEVRGGGRKPWRQKGTGRARAGSIRSPLWRGGGITFGPRGTENYNLKLPLKAKRLAIKQALSIKAEDGAIKVIESIELKEGKTKELAALLNKLKLGRNVLIVADLGDSKLSQAARNLPGVEVVGAKGLNVLDVMLAHDLLITKQALKAIQARFVESEE